MERPDLGRKNPKLMEKIKMNEQERAEFMARIEEAASKINPQTAEVIWTYALTLDPYGILPELSEEAQQVGREYFARAP